MGKQTILVVDDEKNIVELIRLYLSRDGFGVEDASNGREALEKVQTQRPDLVVLDIMMPEMDGWEVCRSLRKGEDIPIIILSCRTDDTDRIVGLELGADDYITKPFNPRELVARVKTVLRRYGVASKPPRMLTLGNVRIDLDRREAHIGTEPLALRAKEFDLLVALGQNVGTVLDRKKILDEVWGYEYYGDTRTVDVHVAWLREKLEESAAEIQTVWGVGYKLVVRDGYPR